MAFSDQTSQALLKRAERVIPGGVNSPARAFRSVGGSPVFLNRGKGCYVWDEDGNRYLDYLGSWGPLIFGHADPDVLAAVSAAAQRGTSFGAPTEAEVRFAELLVEIVPCLEKVRLVNSGTEATMSALRLARGFTRRNLIVKAAGAYHGHVDGLLVRAGSGALTHGVPDSSGIPSSVAQETVVIPFNDASAVTQLWETRGADIAALIIEPVVGNMGVVAPLPGYLEQLRDMTLRSGSLLIFDEVMTGFRLALGGAQERFKIVPDLCCLGKILGGGFPVGAYGGRREIMDQIAPLGGVYQAGTLSGNPVAVAAGLNTLERLQKHPPYAQLERYTTQFAHGVLAIAQRRNIPLTVNHVGSMITLFFQEGPVVDLSSAEKSDVKRFARFHRELLQRGMYWPPSQFEAAFVSACHGDSELAQTLEIVEGALAAL